MSNAQKREGYGPSPAKRSQSREKSQVELGGNSAVGGIWDGGNRGVSLVGQRKTPREAGSVSFHPAKSKGGVQASSGEEMEEPEKATGAAGDSEESRHHQSVAEQKEGDCIGEVD